MRILRIGDPHIRPSNIEEADRLMAFAKQVILGGKIDRLEILGDLFHTHAIIRLEVLEFWNKWLQVFGNIVETIILVGNHDMSGSHNSRSHALSVFKELQGEGRMAKGIRIIDTPTRIGIFSYIPYIHDHSAFLEATRQLNGSGAKVLICHQTFSGSRFDNGFYAKDGINPDEIPFDTIISGHIHKEQIMANGKVDYPGTPKWDSLSDANERKGIWLYEHDDTTGKVLTRDMISTENVCTPIVSLQWLEGDDQPTFPENAKVSIELVGSGDWVTAKKKVLKGKAAVSTKITDKVRRVKKESTISLELFLLNTYPTTMDRNGLLDYAREIGIVQR